MADLPRRGRNRPDSRQMWDESERRNRHGPGARDRRDDRDAYREDSTRDKDRRHRSRSRSPRRDRRDRHRSRSRERRDRDRDRDYDRQQPQQQQQQQPQRPRRDGRFKERDRDGRRDDDLRGDFKLRPRDTEDAKPTGPPVRGDPNRGREPRRSVSPGLGLPTRPKEDRPRSRGTAGTPLTFKVGKHDDGGGDSRRRRDDRSKSYDAAKDSPRPEERNRATSQDHAMDVDDGGDREEEDDEEDDDVEVADDGLAAMQAMMGFGGFGTTKGAHVAGNNVGAVRKEKKIEYRQYMNRVGGFNRPLSPGR